MPSITAPGVKDRTQILAEARGLKGENFPLGVASSAGSFTTGDVRGALIPFRAGDTLSNLTCYVNVAGAAASTTHAQLAVYSLAGVLLARTADSAGDRTAFESVGIKSFAITNDGVGTTISSYTVPSEGALYIACFLAFSSTAPQLARAATLAQTIGGVGSGATEAWTQAGQSSLPAPATITGGTGNVNWFGWL